MDDGNVDLELSPEEEKKVEEKTSIGAAVVHEAIRAEGEAELRRPNSALAWSALASGLSMGFSLVAEGLLRAHLPDSLWRPLIAKFGYSLGFLIVILGRQQLFTENTLTVILPLLQRRDRSTLVNVLRLWLVVLTANLAGACLFIFALRTPVFPPFVLQAFGEIGRETMQATAVAIFLKAIFSGWLIALMVWLLPTVEGSRVAIIVIITYVVALGGFCHIIAGSVETMYLVATGVCRPWEYVTHYMLPTLCGNILGGVSLVAALNHAQVVAGKRKI
jgi:formate/nitrite transporter FocA (FNT family)